MSTERSYLIFTHYLSFNMYLKYLKKEDQYFLSPQYTQTTKRLQSSKDSRND